MKHECQASQEEDWQSFECPLCSKSVRFNKNAHLMLGKTEKKLNKDFFSRFFSTFLFCLQ